MYKHINNTVVHYIHTQYFIRELFNLVQRQKKQNIFNKYIYIIFICGHIYYINLYFFEDV